MSWQRRLSRLHIVRLGERVATPNPRRTRLEPRGEGLEPRQLLATGTGAVVVDAASTVDSQGVTVSYDIAPGTSAAPLSFGIYRSSQASYAQGTSTAASLASFTASAADATPGHHEVTIPVAGGLAIDPSHPYVVAVADPAAPGAADPGRSASFRTRLIGVVTHGGIQDTSWKNGPAWELKMSAELRSEGYDAVIPFNWVAQSNTAGAAAKQAPRLVKKLLAVASQLPSSDPVDIQFIGHSEGTVINSLAISRLADEQTPQIRAGFLQDTILDPHAANADLPGRQYSVADGPVGWITKGVIDAYQAKAKDPAVTVPPRVNSAEVFYQQSPADRYHGSITGVYNLWGQVPVKGKASYFDLTSLGVIHSGKHGVYSWYLNHVVPTLGTGDGLTQSHVLTASHVYDSPASLRDVDATFAGTAFPGSTVTVQVGPQGPTQVHRVGSAVAGADGAWQVVTTPLRIGTHRVIVRATPPRGTALLGFNATAVAPLGPTAFGVG